MALAGKKYFNALGRSACSRGLPITESRAMRQSWNRWAREAYAKGWLEQSRGNVRKNDV